MHEERKRKGERGAGRRGKVPGAITADASHCPTLVTATSVSDFLQTHSEAETFHTHKSVMRKEQLPLTEKAGTGNSSNDEMAVITFSQMAKT